MLNYDRGICDERPEIIWLKLRVALEVFEEGLLISVVVRNYLKLAIVLISIGTNAHRTA